MDDRPRGKKMLKQLSRTRLFTVFENPALLSLLRSRGEKARNSNPVKNRVLESRSYIFFTLVVVSLLRGSTAAVL